MIHIVARNQQINQDDIESVLDVMVCHILSCSNIKTCAQEMSMMYIVTGASDNHFQSLLQFLHSLPPSQYPNTFVWDLGLSEENRIILQSSFPSLRLRRFPYDCYPAYFNITVAAGEYAWKPVAIWLTALEVQGGTLLWCDAGNIVQSLDPLVTVIRAQGVYTPISAGTVQRWTHPACLAFFQIKEGDELLGMSPRNGAIVGFDLDNARAWALLEEWAAFAQRRECIAPIGSNRENHRQDQAVLTILYYRYTGGELLESRSLLLTHQDCDKN